MQREVWDSEGKRLNLNVVRIFVTHAVIVLHVMALIPVSYLLLLKAIIVG